MTTPVIALVSASVVAALAEGVADSEALADAVVGALLRRHDEQRWG